MSQLLTIYYDYSWIIILAQFTVNPIHFVNYSLYGTRDIKYR